MSFSRAFSSPCSLYCHPPEHYLGLPPRIVDDSFPYPPDMCRDLHLDKEQASKIFKLIEDRLTNPKSDGWEYISSKTLQMPCKIVLNALSYRVVIIPKKSQVKTYSGQHKICRMALILTVEKAEPIFRRVCHQKEPKKSTCEARPLTSWQRESYLYNLFSAESLNPFVTKFFEISSFVGKTVPKHPRHGFYEFYPEDLHAFLNRGGIQNIAILKELVIKIVEIVQLMHGKKIAHRDLKLENVLIKGAPGKYRLAVCDVEQALRSGEKIKSMCGTPVYWPPEQLLAVIKKFPDIPEPQVVDLYCLAVIFYQLLHKRLPFWTETKDPTGIADYILLRGNIDKYKTISNESIKICLTPELKKGDFKTCFSHLTNWMLHANPKKRPSLVTISNFLKKIIDKD